MAYKKYDKGGLLTIAAAIVEQAIKDGDTNFFFTDFYIKAFLPLFKNGNYGYNEIEAVMIARKNQLKQKEKENDRIRKTNKSA